MQTTRRILNFMLLGIFILVVFPGCDAPAGNQSDISIENLSFRDIPGVNEEEIRSIEELQRQYKSFAFGVTPGTEAFISVDGEIGGFSALFCQWLSGLFGIRFDPVFIEFGNVFDALQRGEIDFSAAMRFTEEFQQTHFATDPVALRTMKMFRIEGSLPLDNIALFRPPRYGFFRGTVSIDQVLAVTDPDTFEIVLIDNFSPVYEMLQNNEIDAFVVLSPAEAAFDRYNDIIMEDFLPLVFGPVSLSTRKPELEPIISVVQKALENGSHPYILDLYRQGYFEYRKQKLFSRFSEEEQAFINNTPVVWFVSESDSYPHKFFNVHVHQWQGISFDLLKEVSELTGLNFQLANDQYSTLDELLTMLYQGEASMFLDMIHTRERERNFIWTETNVLEDNFAFLSRAVSPRAALSDVIHLRVGVVLGSAMDEMFNDWFPFHKYLVRYDSFDNMQNALEQGEVDIILTNMNRLLAMSNFYENPGFKADIIIQPPYYSGFGFNRDEVILRSIVDKALRLIDSNHITIYWQSKTFDYRTTMVQAQRFWINTVFAALVFVLVLLTVAYIRDRKKSKTIVMQAADIKLAEKSLREAHELSQVMLDTVPLCCCLVNRNYQCIACNDAAVRLFELKDKQEFLDEFAKLSPEFQPDGSNSFEKAYKIIDNAFKGDPFVGEWTHQLLDGTPIPAITTYERVKYGDDYIVFSYARDMREHKRLTTRIETIINNLPGMVFQQLYNPPDYTYTFVSEGCKELLGYMPEEFMNGSSISFSGMIHPEDMGFVEKLSSETLLNGLPFEATFRVITKDGNIKWIWERSRVIEKNEDGTPRLVEGYQTDVTERHQLQEAEREHERMSSRIEAIISNLPGMAYQCHYAHPTYPLTFVSEGSKELLGYTPQELIGGENMYMAMVHPDDLEGQEKKSAETLEHGLLYEHTNRLVMKDGTIKWVLERCRVLEWNEDGTPRLLEGYVFDISDQRRFEAAEIANRAKTEFLAKMSHEIRTPMNSIMGFAELATDSESKPEMQDYLEKIIDSTKWLLHIINDILDISKIEAGKMELERVPFDLRDVFSRCQSVILPSIKDKGLDLRIYAEPSEGKKLLGDPLRLYQVLINLLSNAVKFTDSGTIKFSSAIKNLNNNNTTVYFEVKDSGIGMSPAQINRIFDLFTQADSSTTREYGGSGLGLAISKNIVELMNGKLMVESSPGSGSTFSFELTFDTVDVSDDKPSEYVKFDMLEKPYFEGLVLVCDDNSMNLEVICAHLARVGLGTITAENGKIGVEIVRERINNKKKPFDLILMDMFMPVMDGIEAASKIMALNTESPIVAMTANVMVSELEKYKKFGMPDCLGKPFTSQELWNILLKYLVPISSDLIEGEENNEELQRKLQINFVKNNQTIHTQIKEAAAAGDTKQAHRLAHSLKGNAGMIGKTALRNAAAEVEVLLKDGIASVWDNKMNILKTELTIVLDELKQLYNEVLSEEHVMKEMSLDTGQMSAFIREQTLALFDKLQPMLENDNTDSVDLLDKLRTVPGAGELIQQIEDFDFKSAAGTLAELRKKLVS